MKMQFYQLHHKEGKTMDNNEPVHNLPSRTSFYADKSYLMNELFEAVIQKTYLTVNCSKPRSVYPAYGRKNKMTC